MKITITEHYSTTTTEIEADARELRESNTLAGNVSNLLRRVLTNQEPLEDEENDEQISED